MSAAPAGPRPKKPRGCPLFAHAGGTWCKTVNGKHVHFGPWHDLPGAVRRWEQFDAARRAGHRPRDLPDGSITLKALANRYLTYHHDRAAVGQITLRSFRDLKAAAEAFLAYAGPTLPVNLLQPDNFAAYRAKLMARLGRHAIKREITLVKQMFKWGYETDLLEHPVKYGPGFKGEKKETAAQRRKRRDKSFTPEEIRKMVALAPNPLRAMILLGINCGFGNTDIGTVEWADLDLDAGILDTHRHKTGVARRATLWPETVAALRDVRAMRRKAAATADRDAVFLNQAGRRYVREEPELEGGTLVGQTIVDNVPQEFGRLMQRLGVYGASKRTGRPISDGRGFYCLRRSHRTWADEVKDPHAAARVMGHGDESMAAVYVQRISDERIRAVCDHVRARVFTAP